MKVLIICGNHFRHRFMIEPIFKKFKKIKCIIMKRESQKKGKKTILLNSSEERLLSKHFKLRYQKELISFGNKTIYDLVLPQNIIDTDQKNLNSKNTINYIKKFNPDICFLMGPNLLSQNLIKILPKKTFNIHLGLSPWYRGSATLFWPSYNLEPWKTGITFHKLSQDADAGPIIHQSIAKLKKGMDLFDLSISAIQEGKKDFIRILDHIIKRKKIKTYKQRFYGKSYSGSFFRASHLKVIYELFNDRIVDYFLKNKNKIKKLKLIKLC
ncbi:formyltransferase family protein [Candidatus Pelagibacter sp.]|nr:formyltransferase family protein [Candidatus Pelagibacter sp.]